MKRILVTGTAGFIGFHLSSALLAAGHKVTGIDNMNSYYDVKLKQSRLALLQSNEHFEFLQADIENRDFVRGMIKNGAFHTVVHLAAQAGVRYSLTHPEAYAQSNLMGFFSVLDACKEHAVPHLVYASSSSVYGANTSLPFKEQDKTETPVSLYAATKKANELMAYSYSSMFGLKTTGFRFFTVYGPYGRPDMACFTFTKNILEGKPIHIYNHGDMQRDFTYVDDVISGIVALMEKSAALSATDVPYRIYNIGNSSPVCLMDFVKAIESELGKKAIIELLPMQTGDVKSTYADVSQMEQDTGFAPKTTLEKGIHEFVAWYRDYYLDGSGQ